MIRIGKAYAQRADSARFLGILQPEILANFRLEVDPRGDTYEEGLSARVADPLWMLARQWQFREFAGEDAGTPVTATYQLSGQPVIGYAPGREPNVGDFREFRSGDLPLETRVEAEPLLSTGAHPRALGLPANLAGTLNPWGDAIS